jgi:hypothetical protein
MWSQFRPLRGNIAAIQGKCLKVHSMGMPKPCKKFSTMPANAKFFAHLPNCAACKAIIAAVDSSFRRTYERLDSNGQRELNYQGFAYAIDAGPDENVRVLVLDQEQVEERLKADPVVGSPLALLFHRRVHSHRE